MRISDWNSDVCSSDLRGHGSRRIGAQVEKRSVGCQNTADLGEQVAAVHLADPGDDRTEFLGELLARLEEDALLAVESQRQDRIAVDVADALSLHRFAPDVAQTAIVIAALAALHLVDDLDRKSTRLTPRHSCAHR